VWASAALPRLGGRAPVFRGERMADGALIEPIPFETACAEGATHVLILRSRPAGYRRGQLAAVGERFAIRHGLQARALARVGQAVYNRQADALQRATTDPGAPALLQVAVPDGTRLIGRLDAHPERVVHALALGAAAMASSLLTDAVHLCWQPVVYRAAPAAWTEATLAPVQACAAPTGAA
jgi:predicted acylesterase/phospholipase RssA